MSIKKHIPNAITSMNLLCGSLGVITAILGHMDTAFMLMIAGGIFDFFDGFAARLLGVSSPMGKELDSLADTVSFGLLPAVMMVLTLGDRYGMLDWTCWVPIIIAVFSGIRLAKFNIDTRQTTSFLGMPTPACAMICGSLAYYAFTTPIIGGQCAYCLTSTAITAVISSKATVIPLSLLLSCLLISEIPMFSLKFHKGEKIGAARTAFICVAVLSLAVTAILKLNWSFAVFISFTGYILINIINAIAVKSTERK